MSLFVKFLIEQYHKIKILEEIVNIIKYEKCGTTVVNINR